MDTFDNNYPQQFNAQIRIRPNSDAEARQLEALERQAQENDDVIREMRSLNMKTIEMMNRVEAVLNQVSASGAEMDQVDIRMKLDQILASMGDGSGGDQEVLAKLEEVRDSIAAQGQASNEYVHDQNIKVYRNVQGCVKDELEKSGRAITEANNAAFKATLTETLENLEIDTGSGLQKATLIMAILAFVTALGGIIFQILVFTGILI